MGWREAALAVILLLAAVGCGRGASNVDPAPGVNPPPANASANETEKAPPIVVGTWVEVLEPADVKAAADLGVGAPTLTLNQDGTWRRDDLGVISDGTWAFYDQKDAYVLTVKREDGEATPDRKPLELRVAGDDTVRLTDTEDGGESTLTRRQE